MSRAMSLGDTAADELVQTLSTRDEIWGTNLLLKRVVRNADPLPEELSPEVHCFFSDWAQLPTWACPARMERAARFAELNLPYLSVSLLCASMPLLFANAKGASVLKTTGRLLEDVDTRVNETGRFVLDVLEPGAFGPDGKAFRSSLKVRLVHASVRYQLAQHSSAVPIDQRQMLTTLLAFSIVGLRSMRRLGVTIKPHEAEDFWHLWKVVGVLLGVREELLPSSWQDAELRLNQLLEQEQTPSENARQLTAVLLDGINRHLPLPGMAERLVRYLLDERIADLIGVPPARSGWVSSAWFTKYAPRVIAALSPLCGRHVHERVVHTKLKNQVPSFAGPFVNSFTCSGADTR